MTNIKYQLKATHPVDGSVEGDGVWKRGGAHHAAPLGQQGGLKLSKIRRGRHVSNVLMSKKHYYRTIQLLANLSLINE